MAAPSATARVDYCPSRQSQQSEVECRLSTRPTPSSPARRLPQPMAAHSVGSGGKGQRAPADDFNGHRCALANRVCEPSRSD